MVRLAVLGEDTDAPQGALLAGDVQRGVSSEVPDFQVASGLQKMLSNFRLVSDHCQVKRSLQAKEKMQICKLHPKLGSNIWTDPSIAWWFVPPVKITPRELSSLRFPTYCRVAL